jgi:hypothetical protein
MKGEGFNSDRNVLLEKQISKVDAGKLIDYYRAQGYNWKFHRYMPFDEKNHQERVKEVFEDAGLPLFARVTNSELGHLPNFRGLPFDGVSIFGSRVQDDSAGVYFTIPASISGKTAVYEGFGVAEAHQPKLNYKIGNLKFMAPMLFLRNAAWESTKLSNKYLVQVVQCSDDINFRMYKEEFIQGLAEKRKQIETVEQGLVKLLSTVGRKMVG